MRVFFDTSTFQRITKDRAVKLVDKLSAVGGTMGLLTGFSVISGVEIFFFLLIERHVRLVRFLAVLHLVLPGGNDLEQGPIPLASLHFLEENIIDAS